MKKKLLIAFALLGIVISSQAQKSGQSPQGKIQHLKIAFLTKKLELTPEEAQKFWPAFNSYESDVRKVRKEMKDQNDEIAMEEKIIEVRKKYRAEFAAVLNPERANKVFQEEKEFNRTIQKELQNRQNKRRHP